MLAKSQVRGLWGKENVGRQTPSHPGRLGLLRKVKRIRAVPAVGAASSLELSAGCCGQGSKKGGLGWPGEPSLGSKDRAVAKGWGQVRETRRGIAPCPVSPCKGK